MNARNNDSSCSLQIIRTPSDNLYQYQLLLRCPPRDETVQYILEVIKEGKSGVSRNRQSGSIKLDQPQRLLGNLRINQSDGDTVTVKGTILNQHQSIIVEARQTYSRSLNRQP